MSVAVALIPSCRAPVFKRPSLLGDEAPLVSVPTSPGELHMSGRHDSIHDVSVIGLGAMGSGIARTLLARGCRVSVWNRSRE